MKSILSWLVRGWPGAEASSGLQHQSRGVCGADGPVRSVAQLQEEIIAQGLNADRARALGAAHMTEGRLIDALEAFQLADQLRRDGDLERDLVRMRIDAFSQLDRSLPSPQWPPIVPDGPSAATFEPLAPKQLTPGVLRRGILRHGSLWVRGLLHPTRVARLRAAIDRAIEAQEAVAAGSGGADTGAWCAPIEDLPDGDARRFAVRAAQGVLTVDSPRALHEFLETIRELHIDRLIASYLGERACLSAEKCTLRRLDPAHESLRLANWHQDGAFLGRGIRSVNVWMALSRCGRMAPGMDLIPVRLEHLLPTGGPRAYYDWTVSPQTIARELPDVPICRPEFEAGDVLFFDELCLHRTAAEAGMSDLRYGIEAWFFAASVYPRGSLPLVV